MSVINKLDELIKSVEESLEKMSPVVAGAVRGAAVGAVTGGVKGALGKKAKKAEDCDGEDDEKLLKPKDKAEKADGAPKPPRAAGAPKERTLDYSKMNKPKAPEADAPTISYSQMSAPARTSGSASAEAGFKTPKEKQKVLTDPKFRSKLAEQRKRAGFSKSEDFGKITESLTKSMRAQHSDGAISEMLKAAVDANQIHANVLIEWINYRTINPAIMSLVQYEDEA